MKTYGPYETVRRAGDMLYISGQVGVDPVSSSAPRSIAEQTHLALDNLMSTLEKYAKCNVIKTNIYLVNMEDFKAVNEIYVQYFDAPRPARTCVGVADLPHVADVPLLIEIDAIVHLKGAGNE